MRHLYNTLIHTVKINDYSAQKTSHLTNIPIALLSLALGHLSVMPGVDWHSTIHTSTIQETMATQAGKTSGQQSIAYKYQGRTIDVMQVRLIGKKLYVINTNATVIHNLLNIKLNIANTLRNRWVLLPTSFSQYANIDTGLTVPSVMNELQMNGKVTELRDTVFNHQKAIPLKGLVPGSKITEIIYLSAIKSPLPIGIVAKQGSDSSTTYFGPWKAPKVFTPTHFVTYSAHMK